MSLLTAVTVVCYYLFCLTSDTVFVLDRAVLVCYLSLVVYNTVSLFQAIVLEGKYWKRKLNSVTTEYMKWRAYHKKMRRAEDGSLIALEEVKHPLTLLYFSTTNCRCLPGIPMVCSRLA